MSEVSPKRKALNQQPRLRWSEQEHTGGRFTKKQSHRTSSGAPTRLRARGPSIDEEPTCRLIDGDNLKTLTALQEAEPGSVTLAYLDPPFLTNREFFKKEPGRVGAPAQKQTKKAFDDRWTGMGQYLDHLAPRIVKVRELLADHGSMVLHVDSKTVHYAKVLCDEIFGIECFESEVIWRYRRWPAKTPNFQRVHDVMLRYVKNRDVKPRFNQLYEPLAPSTQATWGNKKQPAVVNPQGRRLRSSKTEETSKGAKLGDVWEISIVAPVAKERTGYPTQKPEALMRRWVEACSDPGDTILDPYMGSGTTLKVGLDLKRRVIGLDSGQEAFNVVRQRLIGAQHAFSEYEIQTPLAKGNSGLAPVILNAQAS